jgi:hypothetical protein
MLDLKVTIIAAGAAFVIGATSAWWVTADYKNSKHQAIVSEMQIKANVALQEALVKTLEIERQNQQLAQDIEVMSAKHKQELQNVENDLRNLIDSAGGLFDPNAANCPAGKEESAAPSKPVNQAARGNISKDLERLLLSESRRADEAAAYANTCYEWVKSLREQESAR